MVQQINDKTVEIMTWFKKKEPEKKEPSWDIDIHLRFKDGSRELFNQKNFSSNEDAIKRRDELTAALKKAISKRSVEILCENFIIKGSDLVWALVEVKEQPK